MVPSRFIADTTHSRNVTRLRSYLGVV